MSQLASRAGAGDQIVLVLIGHGSGDGPESKISIPGPDLSASDFAQMLAKFKTQKVAFIDMTSASGDMLPVVSAPNRVVITATKSSFERNESHFAQFFVDALTKDVADVDKDGRVSLLEAFRYAVAETKRAVRDRHEAADGARAARRRGREDGRDRSRRSHGAGPARPAVLSRRRRSARRPRTIRSSRRCTRTSSRSRIRSTSCAARNRR